MRPSNGFRCVFVLVTIQFHGQLDDKRRQEGEKGLDEGTLAFLPILSASLDLCSLLWMEYAHTPLATIFFTQYRAIMGIRRRLEIPTMDSSAFCSRGLLLTLL